MKRLVTLLASLCVGTTVLAQGTQTVYRTVDETGAVSFSDTPPESEQPVDALTIEVASPVDPQVYQQNLEAMRETTDRMAQDRREREKHRAQMRELAVRDAPAQAAPPENLVEQYSTGWYSGYYGGHGYRPGRPPWRPGYRPRPEHPIVRPPARPLPAYPTQSNSQLMRPILSRGN